MTSQVEDHHGKIQEYLTLKKNADDNNNNPTMSESAIVDKIEHVDVSHLYQTMEIKGVIIYYAKVGTGNKPLLLMNGSMGSLASDFGPILERFQLDKFTVVSVDFPGTGKSIPPERDFSSKETFMHSDIEFSKLLMEKLGYSKFSILGWCGGGTEALIMAGKYPEVIENLISINAKAHFGEQDNASYNFLSDVNNWSELAKSSMVKVYGEEYFFKSWLALISLYKRIYEEDEGNICAEFLPLIKCPTLLVHGQLDPVAPVYHVHFIKERIPHAKLHIMENGKHNLHLKYPKEFLKCVEDFLLEN